MKMLLAKVILFVLELISKLTKNKVDDRIIEFLKKFF